MQHCEAQDNRRCQRAEPARCCDPRVDRRHNAAKRIASLDKMDWEASKKESEGATRLQRRAAWQAPTTFQVLPSLAFGSATFNGDELPNSLYAEHFLILRNRFSRRSGNSARVAILMTSSLPISNQYFNAPSGEISDSFTRRIILVGDTSSTPLSAPDVNKAVQAAVF